MSGETPNEQGADWHPPKETNLTKHYPPPPEFVDSWDSNKVTPEQNAELHKKGRDALNYVGEVAREFINDCFDKNKDFDEIRGELEKIIGSEKREEIYPGWTEQQIDDLLDEVSSQIVNLDPRNRQ